MSQTVIFGFGVVVFFLGGLGLVLIGLDAFRSWSRSDHDEGLPAFRAAEAARADSQMRPSVDDAAGRKDD